MNEIDTDLEVFFETELNELPFDQLMFGKYKRTSEIINGQNYYKKSDESLVPKFGIWWACGDRWCIGNPYLKGLCNCIAFNLKPLKCLPKSYKDWNWIYRNETSGNWIPAGKRLGIRDFKGNTLI